MPGLKIQSLVRLNAHLGHARREPAVFGGERIRQHFDRFHSAARQLKVEVSGRRVVQACAAHLKRTVGRSPAFDPQSALGASNDAWKDGHERLEIVSREGLDIHLGSAQYVADRYRLQAFGWRVGRDHHLHALTDEGQTHLDEHLFGLAGTNIEWRRLGVDEAITNCAHNIAAARHAGKRHLADRVARRLPNHDVAVDTS